MDETLYDDAPLQAYLALAQKYYNEDRLDLAMRVVQDAFAHEGWEPGLWTAFFYQLQCEYDARMGANILQADDKLSIELPKSDSDEVAQSLKQAALESREKVRSVLGVAFDTPIIITIFLPDAPVHFIVGSYGYVSHKTGLDKICLPHYTLSSPGIIRNALIHELSHVATHELTDHPIPRWLDEGIAEYMEEIPSEAVIRNMVTQYPKLLSLSKIDGSITNASLRKDNPGQVTAAYILAASFIDWWIRQFDLPTLRQAFYYINEGQRVDRAVGHATGHSLRSMERDWRKRLRE